MVDVLQKQRSQALRKRKPMLSTNQSTKDVRSLPDNAATDLVQFFKLFSDETRLRIMHYLMQRHELNVRSLCELLGQSQPAVSHHLALLRVGGLIQRRRDGKHNFYRVTSGRLQQLIETVFNVTEDQPGKIRFETFSVSYKPTAPRT